MKIPVNEPLIGEAELENVTDSLKTGWISSSGKYIEEFETGWASYCGRRYGVACSSGTAALHLAIAALDMEPGAQVIMPTFTIISCATAVVFNGGKPVLVDSAPETWCMETSGLEQLVTSKTRAIMAVHIYGHPVNMDPILEVAERHQLAVIEDAAEAHGAQYRRGGTGEHWQMCGSFGEMSCFSFYANKLVTTGEGGMVLTDNPELATKLRSLRNLSFQPRRFFHETLGYNFRLTNLQAAIGVAQMKRIDATVERKRECAQRYRERLSKLEGLELQQERPWARSVWWMFGVVVKERTGLNAEKLADLLLEKGVETRPFFLGMHAQPALKYRRAVKPPYPVANRLSEQGLYLPSGTALSDEQIDQVCDAMEEILG